MEIHKVQKNDVQKKFYADDDEYMTSIEVDGNNYIVNKYMKVKKFKRLLTKSDYTNQWPKFYDKGDGTCYEDQMLLKLLEII
jgi:hypothetical protein